MSVPRTRGDDPTGMQRACGDNKVFPAHAGMIPSFAYDTTVLWSIPRVLERKKGCQALVRGKGADMLE